MKLWVFDVSGSRVETERGLEDEVFAIHVEGHHGPHSGKSEMLTLMVSLDLLGQLVAGAKVMAAEAGKTEELERIVDAITIFDARD